MSVGAFSSVDPRPSKAQTFWLQEAVKLAAGATLPAGADTVTCASRGTALDLAVGVDRPRTAPCRPPSGITGVV